LAQGEKTTCTGPSGKCNNCRSECCSCRQGKSGCYDRLFTGAQICT